MNQSGRLGTLFAALAALTLASPMATAQQAVPSNNAPLLRAIGAAAVGNAYMAFMSVSVIGDAVEKKAYKAKRARGLLDEVIHNLKHSGKHLAGLKDAKLDEKDAKFVQDVLAMMGKIVAQAELLKDHTATGDKAKWEEFKTLRKSNFETIKRIGK